MARNRLKYQIKNIFKNTSTLFLSGRDQPSPKVHDTESNNKLVLLVHQDMCKNYPKQPKRLKTAKNTRFSKKITLTLSLCGKEISHLPKFMTLSQIIAVMVLLVHQDMGNAHISL